ncbi:MAG: matrixin family metalloprotease [Candidatus Sericytochromatia bacterium]
MKKQNIFSLLICSVIVLSTSIVDSKEITINSKSIKKIQDKSLKENAEKAFKNKEFNDAVKYYRDLVKKDNSNEEYIYKLAISLYEVENYKDSETYFNYLNESSSNSKYLSDAKNYLAIIKSGNFPKKNNKKSLISVQSNSSEDNFVELSDNDNHYLCNPDINQRTILKEGNFVRWDESDFPLKIYIPKVPEKYQGDSKVNYAEVAKSSMRQWANRAPNIVKLSFVSSASSANVVVEWLEYFKDEAWGKAHLPEFDPSKGKRFSRILLATKAKPGSALFSSDATNFGDDEFNKLVVHEFGHTLGLVHSYKSDDNLDIMAPVFSLFKRDISDRDLASLKKLYSLPKDSKVICK